MKLSEAIMMNGMTKPQGFGVDSMYSSEEPCALGGALQAAGEIQDYSSVDRLWPWLKGIAPICPANRHCSDPVNRLSDVIWHLNDTHKWTRAQIAEWVSTIEPADEPTLEPQAPAVETTQETTK